MNRLPVGLIVLACTALVACKGDDTDIDDTDTCENAVLETYPVDGETGAYYRTSIEVKFDDFEDGATFTVTDAGGTEVTGTQTWVGDRLILEPASPLAAQTTYTTSIDFSCGTPSVSWTTSEVGGALGTPANLNGRSYLLDLASGRFVEPEGVGDFLGDYLDQIVLVGVDTASATEIQMLGALGYENTNDSKIYQEPCIPSIDFPMADFIGNPFFNVGPEDTTLSVAGFEVDIQDLQVSGAFAPDGTYISGAT
ncbi:MAG: Ig-like domain-containing protein, partial [Deltaproteobacteria bacterium]|nr:Ig-like domain-containing protein [Deltaproteobacteria bacterium]